MNAEPTSLETVVENDLSIGIIAWNEEQAIQPFLKSLFNQSLLAELHKRGRHCEILCIANGCTDRTPQVAAEIFAQQSAQHPHANAFSGRVVNLRERGKINAWNQFVHVVSAPEARYLFLMDADIVIHNRETLWNMLLTLETNAEANVSVDVPRKDVEIKGRKSIRDRVSLAASRPTRSSAAQLCGQLYCIRAQTARNIYLPRDLSACDDGLIKALVCTDFLAHGVWPMRIQVAHNASHTFEAYTSLKAILKNQKRQMIGQTMVHLVVDQYLRKLPSWQRSKLAETLKKKEQEHPTWLRDLVQEHLRRTHCFWRLYPGLLTHRFRSLAKLKWPQKIISFPIALAGSVFSLAASFAAFRFLKAGLTQYWPRAERNGLTKLKLGGDAVAPLTGLKVP